MEISPRAYETAPAAFRLGGWACIILLTGGLAKERRQLDKLSQKRERLELLLRYASILVSVASFWIIALFGGYYNADELELIPRLGLAAALSWVVFLHGEAMGMIIMSLMKEKWQREAREEAREQALRESRAELRESQAELRESQDELRESRAELRESREREAQQRETIHELRRRLARPGDDGANGDGGA